MEDINNLFGESNENTILQKIKIKDWNFIITKLSYINDNCLILDYPYFKYFGTPDTYNIIFSIVATNIDKILADNKQIIIYFNMNYVTLSEVDKHQEFFKKCADLFSEKYPNTLKKCYIINPPFIFSQFFHVVSLFINKDTISKIELVKHTNNKLQNNKQSVI